MRNLSVMAQEAESIFGIEELDNNLINNSKRTNKPGDIQRQKELVLYEWESNNRSVGDLMAMFNCHIASIVKVLRGAGYTKITYSAKATKKQYDRVYGATASKNKTVSSGERVVSVNKRNSPSLAPKATYINKPTQVNNSSHQQPKLEGSKAYLVGLLLGSANINFVEDAGRSLPELYISCELSLPLAETVQSTLGIGKVLSYDKIEFVTDEDIRSLLTLFKSVNLPDLPHAEYEKLLSFLELEGTIAELAAKQESLTTQAWDLYKEYNIQN